MRLVFCLLLLLGSTLAGQAQGLPGYVVTLSGDTLRGIVVETPRLHKIRLYTDKQTDPKEFTPATIRGYGLLHHAMLRSVPIRLATGGIQYAFVTRNVEGAASLFSYTNQTGLFLAPPTVPDTLYELNQLNWHLLFNRYLTGCASLHHTNSSMLNMSFTEANITRIVYQYNTCQQAGWRPKASARGHIWQSGVTFRGNYGRVLVANSGTYKGQRYALGAEWTGVRASGFQVSTGVQYLRAQTQSGYYTVAAYAGQPASEEEVRGTESILSTSVSIAQRWGRPQRVKAYVAAGFGFDFNLSSTSEFWQRSTSNTPSYLARTEHATGGILIALHAQAGTIVPTGGLSELRLAAFYSRYVLVPLHMAGLEAAYTLFRK